MLCSPKSPRIFACSEYPGNVRRSGLSTEAEESALLFLDPVRLETGRSTSKKRLANMEVENGCLGDRFSEKNKKGGGGPPLPNVSPSGTWPLVVGRATKD